jgi:hypothetical protein
LGGLPEKARSLLRGVVVRSGFTEAEVLALDGANLEWWAETLGVE